MCKLSQRYLPNSCGIKYLSAFANPLAYTFPSLAIKYQLKPGLKYLKQRRTACQVDKNVLYTTGHCSII